MMEDFQTLRIFNKLKSVYRFATVDNRKESAAEHTWGCLILADYFLSIMPDKLDRLAVYELLLYHDLIEIESGDFPLHLGKIDEKKEAEKLALQSLRNKLPKPLDIKFATLFSEFDKLETPEAVFARAIDALEAEIHELDYKEDWVGYTKQLMKDKKLGLFAKFPQMYRMYEGILDYLEVNGYFDK